MNDFKLLLLCEHAGMLRGYCVVFGTGYMQVNIDCAENNVSEMRFHYECAWLHALTIVLAVRFIAHESRMLRHRMSTMPHEIISAPLA